MTEVAPLLEDLCLASGHSFETAWDRLSASQRGGSSLAEVYKAVGAVK